MNLNDVIAAIASHNWYALLLLIAVYLRTLFSDKSNFPKSISPNWQPVWVAGAGGIIAFLSAEQAGRPIMSALAAGLAGLAVAGFFDGILAACFSKPENAPVWAKWLVLIVDDIEGAPPAAGSGTGAGEGGSVPPVVRPISTAPKASARFALPFAGALRSALLLAAIVLVPAAGCGWLSANERTVVQSLDEVATCIVAQLLKGVSDAGGLTKACDGATFEQVEAIIASLIDYYKNPPSAGSGVAAGQVCGDGPPPVKGAPECLSVEQTIALHRAHASARAARARGEK